MDWRSRLESQGVLTSEVVDEVLSHHGGRGRRAIDAVSEERVKRYRDFTVVVGETDEYIVEEGSCTCDDQRYNLDDDEHCWHSLAVEIADATERVDDHDLWYSEVRDLMEG